MDTDLQKAFDFTKNLSLFFLWKGKDTFLTHPNTYRQNWSFYFELWSSLNLTFFSVFKLKQDILYSLFFFFNLVSEISHLLRWKRKHGGFYTEKMAVA